MRTVSRMRFWQNAVCAVLLVSCDSFAPETEIPLTFSVNEYYILPGSSIVIDLKSVIKQSFASASLSVAQSATRGAITQLDPFLLKYTPRAEFQEGTDQIVVSVQLDDGSMRKGSIDIIMRDRINDFACGTYAVEDRIDVRSRSTVIIHPLKNDRVCGNKGLTNVLIHRGPQHGEAVVSGDSIIFRPDPSFELGDELVYRISSDGIEDLGFGIVSINEVSYETITLPGAFTDMFFMEERVGFGCGGGMIFKTSDGGTHWDMLTYPGFQEDPVFFQDIFFLDEENGFAAFSVSDWWTGHWSGGILITKDGGMTWERSDLSDSAASIFFTSPSNGFVLTIKYDSLGLGQTQSLLKTTNGGETWKEVLSYFASYDDLKLRGPFRLSFGSDQIGYAFQEGKFFGTRDGGDSWTPSFTNQNVTSIATMPDNIAYASVAPYYYFLTSPSTIVRSEDGSTWTQAKTFSYVILFQEFTKSGDLGVAVGMSKELGTVDPTTQIALESWQLTINTSYDRGKSWADKRIVVTEIPSQISVPSPGVVYLLCRDRILKYRP